MTFKLKHVEAKELTVHDNKSNDICMSTAENSDVELSYHINSSWDEHYNVNVTLTNITDEK